MRRILLLAASIAAFSADAFQSGNYSTVTVTAFRAGIATEFSLPVLGSYGKRCLGGCALGHSIGQLVRLPFHDAAGGGGLSGLGGPNGCIDPLSSDNAGLAAVVTRVSNVRAATAPGISLADAFVLAGNYAIEVASTLDPADAGNLGALGIETPVPLILPFRSGRVDAATCAGVDDPLLPRTSSLWSGSLAAHAVSSVFSRMGLSTVNIVALMGAHTVGRLTAANSGINGVWVPETSASFSNRYYRDLVGVPWVKNTLQGSNDVWIAGPANAPVQGVMLRTDVELIFNTTTPTGAAACPQFNFGPGPSNGCPRQTATVNSVTSFAQNQLAWQQAFSAAWTIMTEFNTQSLSPVVPMASTTPIPAPESSGPSAALLGGAIGGSIAGVLLIALAVGLYTHHKRPAVLSKTKPAETGVPVAPATGTVAIEMAKTAPPTA